MTARQLEALQYLFRDSREGYRWPARLSGLYERRWREEYAAELSASPTWSPGQRRRSAWRRTGGSVCARLHRDGYLERSWERGDYSPKYRLTDAGKLALDNATPCR